MAWLQAIVITSARYQHDVECLMNELGALAVTLRDGADDPVLEPLPGATPVWPKTEVVGLFPEQADPQLLESLLQQRLPTGSIEGYRHQGLEDQLWERAWLADFVPQTFGRRLCICPTHCEPPAHFPAVVWLDPGLAFGTGTHATTQLCLQTLADLDLRGLRLIDYGCGSGILSLAALKLGAAEVWAVDNDPQALAATGANAERNGVRRRLRLVAAGEPIEVAADLVVANILASVLCRLAATLGTLARPGAGLLLSGILDGQVAEVRRAYDPQFSRWRVSRRDDWVLLSGERR